MRTRLALAVVVTTTLGATACSSEDPPVSVPSPTPPTSTPTTTSPPTTSTPTPTATPEPTVKRLVLPPAADAMPATWVEQFVIPYGEGEAELGTAPGGDSGSLDIGPEYGAPGPDGSWWFLDGAKQRLAHYDATGAFLDATRIPKRLLVGGTYFQWQLPHVLLDGTLVAFRFTPEAPMMLRLRDGVLDEIAVQDDRFTPIYDDGTRVYGFLSRTQVGALDPSTGEVTRVDDPLTPTGAAIHVGVNVDKGLLKLGGGSLPIRTRSGAIAHAGIQLRAGTDDVLHVLLVGTGEDDPEVQLVGYTSVTADGATRVEPLVDPFSEADPGSPAQLTIVPGSDQPSLVYVLPDGVHVWRHAG